MTGSNARSEDPSDPSTPETRTNRWTRRLRRLGLASVILISAATVGVLATGYFTSSDLTSRVHRVGEVFAPVEALTRPVGATTTSNGRTILAIGADLHRAAGPVDSPSTNRSQPDQTGQSGAEQVGDPVGTAVTEPPSRTEAPRGAVMMMRFAPDQNSVSVVSIPDRTEVDVPGHGVVTVGAAHALGGPPLLIRTVEQLSSVRIDHFMVIDFAELAAAVDVLGGVDVSVAADVTGRNGTHFRAGANQLDADRARAYLRQPDELPEGTVDRVERQQNLLRALLTRAATTRFDVDALENYRLLAAVTRAVSVDDRFSGEELRDLARSAALVEARKIWFLTAPPSIGNEAIGSERGFRLWHAFDTGSIAGYVAEHPDDLLHDTPR
ncbi:LCP family protein [Micromonospora sp. NPDC050397]|uniref:LCP family protein n=1 Tax=Micromonospora sp. NPDC050397 TaxID=3364279 RepID=UPI00384E8CA4